MSKFDPTTIRFHEDAILFQRALDFTAAETGFNSRLIEKDYFCSVLLQYLATANEAAAFKGGTCLSKVYAEFYRLSEDLDFAVSIPTDAPRSQRSKRAEWFKKLMASLDEKLPAFRVVKPATGTNNSTQYVGVVSYKSLSASREETIKIELALREPLLTATVEGMAKTILLDPVSGKELIKPIAIQCISKAEAFAEKFRAALTRREVAIRDFYDIDYAVRNLGLNLQGTALIDLLRQKLAVSANESVDLSKDRFEMLQQQVETQLKPVLQTKEFNGFNLERAFQLAADMDARVSGIQR